jgi:ubiquinone/menaquinone biosynthesis C-methylase UbiE
MSSHCFDVKQAAKLDSEGRLKDLRLDEFVKDVARVAEGMVCIDFGSGTGTFALPLAQYAGNSGKVYAVDNSAEMMGHIQAKKPPPNVVLVQRDVTQTGLDDQIADICLLAFILHEVKQPESLVAEAARLLKPQGRLLVVEWKAELESPGPPKSRRITREQIQQLFGQAGLSLVEYRDWSGNHYIAIGSKGRS